MSDLFISKEQAEGDLLALDAKMTFDDNAMYRQKDIMEMRDLAEEDASEIEASKWELTYINLDGNIGCLVNGAGLAMATMDNERPGQDNVSKLLWANWHRRLGELAMRVVGAPSLVGPPTTSEGELNVVTDPEHVELDEWQRLYLFTRADTIYGGSNEVQRNIVSQTVLGS